MADFHLYDHGSVVILDAVSTQAQAWVAEHLPEGALTWGRHGVVIEPRYVAPILQGITDDGLEVA